MNTSGRTITKAQQGQYDRILRKREHARVQSLRALRHGHGWRRSRYWDRVFHATYGRCGVCGAKDTLMGTSVQECRYKGHVEGEPPHAILCYSCAPTAGFCSFCGDFSVGETFFNFGGDGLCDDCREELRECSPAGVFANPRALSLVGSNLVFERGTASIA